ncbi:hypothetical protein BCR34DRAFT_122924 [Clohesyomyces aquaticus]|uniref:Uncharacterized protein n=1 Tax=Clohesyomyces aquaticus TaxID=1231657 RepID=A0A1Y1YP70_9PLEO|nr:hypothetical protein BCR34DRAFT_122924 [Clohesyomyces aquaticus]
MVLLRVGGASTHAKDSGGHQPIHYSILTMELDIIQTLVDLGADPAAASDDLRTPLHILAVGYLPRNIMDEEFLTNIQKYGYEVPNSLVEAVAKVACRISPSKALWAETTAKETAFALAIKNHRWILAQALHVADAPFDAMMIFPIASKPSLGTASTSLSGFLSEMEPLQLRPRYFRCATRSKELFTAVGSTQSSEYIRFRSIPPL